MNTALPPGPAPSAGRALEFALNLLLRNLEPESKLELARWLSDTGKHLEELALNEMEADERQEPR